MDVGNVVRLHDQRQARIGIGGIVEPGEGAFVGCVGQDLARAGAADAERVFLASVAVAHDVAQLGQHAAAQPFEQARTFRIAEVVRVLLHRLAHRAPVLDRRAHVGQRRFQIAFQRIARFLVGLLDFEVDHRLARGLAVLARQVFQHARVAALHPHDRVNQPVDRKADRRNLRGDRIDEEGHVVVDERDAHPALARVLGGDRDGRLARLAGGRSFEDEGGRIVEIALFERLIHRQQRFAHPVGQSIQQRSVRMLALACHACPVSHAGSRGCPGISFCAFAATAIAVFLAPLEACTNPCKDHASVR